MKKVHTAIFHIETGEEKLAIFNFLQSIFIGLPRLFTLTVASALFLESYSASHLPFIYIASSLTVPVIGAIYLQFEKRVSLAKLYSGTLAALMLVSISFFILLGFTEATWVAAALLIWIEVEWVLSDIVLWGTAGQFFTVRQGKRLFGLISTGAKLVVIIGGLLMAHLVSLMGTENLLLWSIAGFALSLLNFNYMIHIFKTDFKKSPKIHDPKDRFDHSFWTLFKVRYFILIFIFYALFTRTVYYFIDNIFYYQVNNSYPESSQIAAFMGLFLAASGFISLFLRASISGFWMMRFSLLVNLLTYPVLLAICALAIVAVGNFTDAVVLLFWLAIAGKIIEKVFGGAITTPAYQTLYQPLAPEWRNRVRTVAETLVGPLWGALASIFLLILTQYFAVTAVGLAAVLIVLVIVWGILCFPLIKEYQAALATALTRHGFEGSDVPFGDAWSFQVLEKGLRSDHPDEVLYCLQLLEEAEYPKLNERLSELMTHKDSRIRRGVYQFVERHGSEEHFEELKKRVPLENLPQLKGALLRALAACGHVEASDLVRPYLSDVRPEIRQCAMVASLRYCGISGAVRAGSILLELERSPKMYERVFAAEVLGQVGISNFYEGLIPLLQDKEVEVRKAALMAAGLVKNRKLWSLVIANLKPPATRQEAMKVLTQAGESTFPALEATYMDEPQLPNMRQYIIHIYGKTKGTKAIASLLNKLNEPDRNLFHEILWALHFCNYRAEELEKETINTFIKYEVEYGFQALTMWRFFVKYVPDSLLALALQNELVKSQTRIFLLLSFIYDAESIMKICFNFREKTLEKRDIAIELFDNVVENKHKTLIMPLLSAKNDNEERDPQVKLLENLQIILSDATWNNIWVKACALDVASQLLSSHFRKDLFFLANNSPHPLIRETAQCALQTFCPAVVFNAASFFYVDIARTCEWQLTERTFSTLSLSTVEKVKSLHQGSIFAEIPEETLAELAPHLSEIRVDAGKNIFRKGDPGTSLYVIVSGLLRIHDGEETLVELGKGEIFGELAALDPEPRSASVTAIKQSHLLQLSQENLHSLIEEHINVAIGVIQFLCARLRTFLTKKTLPSSEIEITPFFAENNVTTRIPGESLSLVEKIVILKTVSIFAETPHFILSEIARLTHEVYLKNDVMLFKKGDLGTTMYIVVKGKVKVHDGGQKIAELGERALLGEMAALSSEPRTASVTAMENTLLLGLTQEALFKLMWDRNEVVQGIIYVLVQRLRYR